MVTCYDTESLDDLLPANDDMIEFFDVESLDTFSLSVADIDSL